MWSIGYMSLDFSGELKIRNRNLYVRSMFLPLNDIGLGRFIQEIYVDKRHVEVRMRKGTK